MATSRTLLIAFSIALAITTAVDAADRLNVVTTTPDLAAVARSVGGENVDVTALARPTEDAHFVDAKPSFVKLANRADVLIEGGASLEAGWLPPILDGARNPKIAVGAPGRVIASRGIELLDVPAELDRAMGDVHPQGNPHFMLDPVAAKTVAKTIQSAFCAVDGPRCPAYEAGLRTFQATVDSKLAEWKSALEPMKGTKVVTYHKDFDYFFKRFDIEVAGTLEPKPGIPPSPGHLTELVPKMKAGQVALIVIEPYRERSNPDFVAQNTGAKVLPLPTMPDGKERPDYVALIDYDVKQLVGALGQEASKR